MTMDIRKQKLLEEYLASVSRYKDAMQYAKNEPSKFKRAFRNFKTFGFSYLGLSPESNATYWREAPKVLS